LYKQLAVAAGTGFRLDFNYFLIRFDLGFRLKRPDVLKNDGWQFPEISFNNLFRRGKLVPNTTTPDPNDQVNDDRYKKWRYENFNFTIGISYPF
jgi:outer membrane protein insertion porin family